MDFIVLAFGIALAGYCIGDGIKNIHSPKEKNVFADLGDDDDHELIKENAVHYFMGVSKEDAKQLRKEHQDIPHIVINGNVYFPKAKLREWLLKIGE